MRRGGQMKKELDTGALLLEVFQGLQQLHLRMAEIEKKLEEIEAVLKSR